MSTNGEVKRILIEIGVGRENYGDTTVTTGCDVPETIAHIMRALILTVNREFQLTKVEAFDSMCAKARQKLMEMES